MFDFTLFFPNTFDRHFITEAITLFIYFSTKVSILSSIKNDFPLFHYITDESFNLK